MSPENPKRNPEQCYPLKVTYCGNCSMPLEYCEFHPEYAKCKQWLVANMPDEFERVKVLPSDESSTTEAKKRQKRGGLVKIKSKQPPDVVPKKICVARAARGKKKSVTLVTGLQTCDIDLKMAAKFFGQKFACGTSVTGEGEIVIQGDVKDELFDVIPNKWPSIDSEFIVDAGEQKR